MKKYFFANLVVLSLVALAFVPKIAGAEGLVPCGGNGQSACSLCDLIVGFHRLTTFLTGLLITATLAGLFFSGIMYIISAGQEGMMTTAKNFATASLIGFAVVLGAWLIVNVTMWVISAQMTNIDKTSWYEFSCT